MKGLLKFVVVSVASIAVGNVIMYLFMQVVGMDLRGVTPYNSWFLPFPLIHGQYGLGRAPSFKPEVIWGPFLSISAVILDLVWLSLWYLVLRKISKIWLWAMFALMNVFLIIMFTFLGDLGIYLP